MAVQINPDSATAKELATWNRPVNQFDEDGRPGKHPGVFLPYPKMLYKAVTLENGKVVCGEEEHQRLTTVTARSDAEEAALRTQGWRESIPAAKEAHEQYWQDIAQAAAENNYAARNMSPKAKQELAAKEAKSTRHITE